MTPVTAEERTRMMASLSAGLRQYVTPSDQWTARTISLGDNEPIIEIQFSRKIGDTNFNMIECLAFFQLRRFVGSLDFVACVLSNKWKAKADREDRRYADSNA